MRVIVDRVAMINRVQAALRSTLNVEDIHSIILSTLISHEGFNFSRAFLLIHEPEMDRMRGLTALGAIDRNQHDRLQQEVSMETKTLADMVRDLNGVRIDSVEQEWIFQRSLRDLSSQSFWITSYQIYGAVDELRQATQKILLPFKECDPADTGPGEGLLNDVVDSHNAVILPRIRLESEGMPPELLDLLPGESLWKSIRTQKGLRMLIVVDRVFGETNQPLQPIDVLHMDWFAGQASMGLEIAEIHQDIEQAYRELQDIDRIKSNFLATISHELRTPLTAINGYLQLLLGNRLGGISQGQRDVLERVIEHSELLTGKVNDLIEIAELDIDSESELMIEPVDPLAALVAILPRLEAKRARKRMRIDPVVEDAVPTIHANMQALERIFFHLLDNALKFSREETVVEVHFVPQGDCLAVAVKDAGIGISPHQLQNIFEAFYQVDNQLTRHYEGLGIGLTLIKRHLDLTGGRIQVESEPGGGSTFTIVYPLAK